jgi:hypothetical protein
MTMDRAESGRLGGHAAAKTMSPDARSDRARRAAAARHSVDTLVTMLAARHRELTTAHWDTLDALPRCPAETPNAQ